MFGFRADNQQKKEASPLGRGLLPVGMPSDLWRIINCSALQRRGEFHSSSSMRVAMKVMVPVTGMDTSL